MDTVRLVAVVRRCGHNREFVFGKMLTAPPHIMRFIGDGGVDLYEPDWSEMIKDLIEKGYLFSVETQFEDVSIIDFCN